MFEIAHINDVVRLAAAGGGFTMEAGLKQTDDLVRIAAAASANGARITFTGLDLMPIDDLIRIAAAGRGAVSFS